MTFPTRDAAYEYAQPLADQTGQARGIEYNSLFRYWTVRMIPNNRAHRFGCDATCENVEPSTRVEWSGTVAGRTER